MARGWGAEGVWAWAGLARRVEVLDWQDVRVVPYKVVAQAPNLSKPLRVHALVHGLRHDLGRGNPNPCFVRVCVCVCLICLICLWRELRFEARRGLQCGRLIDVGGRGGYS